MPISWTCLGYLQTIVMKKGQELCLALQENLLYKWGWKCASSFSFCSDMIWVEWRAEDCVPKKKRQNIGLLQHVMLNVWQILSGGGPSAVLKLDMSTLNSHRFLGQFGPQAKLFVWSMDYIPSWWRSSIQAGWIKEQKGIPSLKQAQHVVSEHEAEIDSTSTVCHSLRQGSLDKSKRWLE